jgi:hypothetical protein
MQPAIAHRCDEVSDDFPPVDGRTAPDQKQRALNLTQQVFEKEHRVQSRERILPPSESPPMIDR